MSFASFLFEQFQKKNESEKHTANGVCVGCLRCLSLGAAVYGFKPLFEGELWSVVDVVKDVQFGTQAYTQDGKVSHPRVFINPSMDIAKSLGDDWHAKRANICVHGFPCRSPSVKDRQEAKLVKELKHIAMEWDDDKKFETFQSLLDKVKRRPTEYPGALATITTHESTMPVSRDYGKGERGHQGTVTFDVYRTRVRK
jgi:hypothetical protein